MTSVVSGDGPLLRREVDGVAWHVARAAMFGVTEPARRLQVFWTLDGSAEQAADAFWLSILTFENGMQKAGRPLAERDIHARTMKERRDGISGRDELAQILRTFRDGLGDELLHVHVRWDRVSADLMLRDPDPGVWVAQWFMGRNQDTSLIDAVGTAGTEVLARLAAEGVADWGCVTHDHGGGINRTPYEHYFSIREAEGARLASRHPRGYYWSNLLTGRHLEGLGGPAEALAACHDAGLVSELIESASGSPAMIVRARESLSVFTDESLAAIRGLLDPILLHRPYYWYADWPLRVIKEPGTAFRAIDPTILARQPVFDDDEPEPDEPEPDEDDRR
ncbi:MAG: hypothetical protein HOW97_40525 [Catenulispora sp.]|nr:hypothetical protein [Catenulispora sp.]